MSGPLEGTRIIELGQMIAVPAATHLLASYGAEVIKVENTGTGDELRYYSSSKGGISALFAQANAGKRSIALNLKNAAGKEVLWKLLENADALLEGFRPGVLDRLGFGYDTVSKKSPSIVYCSSSGFGPVGPYADTPVYDPLIQSLAGWAGAQTVDNEPTLVRGIVADKVAAWANAQAITAALFKSSRTGEGSHIELGMLESNIAFLWSDVMMHCSLLDDDVTHQANFLWTYRLYRASDGWISMAVTTDKQSRDLCEVLNRQDIIDGGRFETAAKRGAALADWFDVIEEMVKDFPVDELLGRLRKADVPVAPVLSPEDVASDPQVIAGGYLVKSIHPLAGTMLSPRTATHAFGEELTLSPAPSHGQHSKQILVELGYSLKKINTLGDNGVVVLK